MLLRDGDVDSERIVVETMTDPSFHSNRRAFLKRSALVVVGGALLPYGSLSQKSATRQKKIERAAFTMGSIVTITAYCDDERLGNIAIDEAFHSMNEIDRLMSVFDERSQLSRVNREASRREIVVDPMIIDILGTARSYSAMTAGAFDVTIEPLMELYGFRDDGTIHHFPTDMQIAGTLDSVGMKNVSIDVQRSTVSFKQKNTQLDLGGIAVGYAIDKAVEVLTKRGIESAIINHSGDIFAIGAPPDEDAWEVGIVDPLHPESIITTTSIKDQALSTSGNYRNNIEADGKTIGHILDPHNARSSSAMLGTTIIARTALEADALSTGSFVLGVEPTRELVSSSPGRKFIGVERSGEVVVGW